MPLPDGPLLVRFDQDNVLIKEISVPKERDELLFQLGQDVVIGRMDAASALAGFKGDPRVAAAAFKRACGDPDSQVRAAALIALGNLKNRIKLELFTDIFRKDTSYRVKAEALTAIGKTGDSSVSPFLRQAAALPSPRGIVRKAAEAALELIEKR